MEPFFNNDSSYEYLPEHALKEINKYGTIYNSIELPNGIDLNSFDDVLRSCMRIMYPDDCYDL